jgi:hypothetical protein
VLDCFSENLPGDAPRHQSPNIVGALLSEAGTFPDDGIIEDTSRKGLGATDNGCTKDGMAEGVGSRGNSSRVIMRQFWEDGGLGVLSL